jgi:mono/diheme cytochrome c family protein
MCDHKESKMKLSFVAIAALTMAAAGCGSPPAPETPTTDDAPKGDVADVEGDDGAAVTWATMSKDQKIEHMKEAVMPKMGEVFAAFDSDRYGKIKCSTCHGPGANEGKFEMPSPDLPKLSKPTGDGEPFAEEMDFNPEMTKFMMEKVTPEMVKLLPGVKAYDPETHEGFGCFGCHTSK